MSDDLFSVRGKTALVTGGSRGIGAMIARGFVADGARVFIAARKAAELETTAAELNDLGGGSASAIVADLSSEDGARALADAVGAQTDHLDVLVNNAGATWGAPLEDHDQASWDRVLNLNVAGVFHVTKF